MTIRIVSKDQKQAHECDGRELERGVRHVPIVNKMQEKVEGMTSLMVEDSLDNCREEVMDKTEMVDVKRRDLANGSTQTIQKLDKVSPCLRSKYGNW